MKTRQIVLMLVGGAFMGCDYQMQSAQQGAGTCTLSDRAKYQVHIGG